MAAASKSCAPSVLPQSMSQERSCGVGSFVSILVGFWIPGGDQGPSTPPVTRRRVSPLEWRCSADDSVPLRHVFMCGQQDLCCSASRPLSLFRSSSPASCSQSCDRSVSHISLLLRSHSGASVVAVENRYPYLLFLVITQTDKPVN